MQLGSGVSSGWIHPHVLQTKGDDLSPIFSLVKRRGGTSMARFVEKVHRRGRSTRSFLIRLHIHMNI